MNEKYIGFGLNKEPKDKRDLQLGAIIDLPKLSELPESYSLQPLTVKDQLDTDFCSAFSTCSVSELQEGVVLDPLWSFAISKKLSGDINSFGQTISYALKGHIKYGAIGQTYAPFNLETADKNKIRDINNYPFELYTKAIEHRKKSYLECSGGYDIYDNVRASLWKFRNEKRGAVMGLTWHWNIQDYILKGISDSGGGHLIAIIGWTPEGLLLLNSAGRNAGREGLHILPREEANYYIKEYNGAFMFIDLSPEEVAQMIANGVKLEASYMAMLVALINLLKKYVVLLTKSLGEIVSGIFSTKN